MNEELLAVVDDNDQVIDNLPRHRAVHILVFNQIYIHGGNSDALLQYLRVMVLEGKALDLTMLHQG